MVYRREQRKIDNREKYRVERIYNHSHPRIGTIMNGADSTRRTIPPESENARRDSLVRVLNA